MPSEVKLKPDLEDLEKSTMPILNKVERANNEKLLKIFFEGLFI